MALATAVSYQLWQTTQVKIKIAFSSVIALLFLSLVASLYL